MGLFGRHFLSTHLCIFYINLRKFIKIITTHNLKKQKKFNDTYQCETRMY